jgi:hypothetical protein
VEIKKPKAQKAELIKAEKRTLVILMLYFKNAKTFDPIVLIL